MLCRLTSALACWLRLQGSLLLQNMIAFVPPTRMALQAGPIRVTVPAIIEVSGVGVLPLDRSLGRRPPAVITASPAIFIVARGGSTGACPP